MESAECLELEKLISQNSIVVLGTSFCPACVKAKKLLEQRKLQFLNVDLGKTDEKMNECLFSKTNSNFIPQVFVNKKFIGGFQELQYLSDSKLLDDLIKMH